MFVVLVGIAAHYRHCVHPTHHHSDTHIYSQEAKSSHPPMLRAQGTPQPSHTIRATRITGQPHGPTIRIINWTRHNLVKRTVNLSVPVVTARLPNPNAHGRRVCQSHQARQRLPTR